MICWTGVKIKSNGSLSAATATFRSLLPALHVRISHEALSIQIHVIKHWSKIAKSHCGRQPNVCLRGASRAAPESFWQRRPSLARPSVAAAAELQLRVPNVILLDSRWPSILALSTKETLGADIFRSQNSLRCESGCFRFVNRTRWQALLRSKGPKRASAMSAPFYLISTLIDCLATFRYIF